MANYSVLKAAVQAVVKTNGNQEITGANMQSTLISIINSLGTGYQFMGVATPSTSPGTPDYNVAYIGGAGTYANFGTSVTVPVGSICVFKYNGSWTSEILSDGLVNRVNKIDNEIAIMDDGLTYSLGERNDGYDVVWGKVISGDGDIDDSATFNYIRDYFQISLYSANINVKVNNIAVVVGLRYYDDGYNYIGTTYSASAAYFRVIYGDAGGVGSVVVYDSTTQIFPNGWNKAASESEVSDIDTRLESVEDIVNGHSEPQVVLKAYITGTDIIANSAWTTVIAKVKPNQTVSLVSISTSTIRYMLYSASPSIGSNADIAVGSMVTGTTTATIPNVLPFYYVGFSIQADRIDEPNIHIDGDMYVSENIGQRVDDIEVQLAEIEDPFLKALPAPFYGNLLYEKCPNFVKAMKEKNKDVTVCLTGTSLTQGNLYVSLRPDRLERPPLMQGYDLTSAVYDVLSKLWVGQQYRRFDHTSVTRSSSTWSDSGVNAIWDDSGAVKNGYTGSTTSANAFIRYTVPSDAWRFNFIYRTDTEGGNCSVAISEGNNKMEVWNGSAWVEANGYTFSMLEPPTTATKGNTCYQKRLNMRCKNKVTGGINSIGSTKTITISKGNNSSRFNVVGFEWSPREFMLTVINGARGGHCWGYQTEIGVPESNNLEKYQDLDLWEFKPDLILCEVTAINWAAGSERSIAYDPNWFVNLAKRHYFNEFNDCSISLYEKSNGYEDCEIVFYGDTLSVSGTNANVWNSNGSPVFAVVTDAATNGDTDTTNVGRVKTAIENYDAVDSYMMSKDKLFIPVTEKVINFSQEVYGTYKKAFAASGATGDTLSYDETHLNDKGVRLWSAFILPLFDLF